MGGKFLETGSGVCVMNGNQRAEGKVYRLKIRSIIIGRRTLFLYWNAIVPAVECLLSSSRKELVPPLGRCAPLLEALQKEPIDNPEALQMPL